MEEWEKKENDMWIEINIFIELYLTMWSYVHLILLNCQFKQSSGDPSKFEQWKKKDSKLRTNHKREQPNNKRFSNILNLNQR